MKQFLQVLVFTFFSFAIAPKAHTQNFSSIKRMAINSGMTIKSIAIDADGNKFIAGSFGTQLNFEEGLSVTSAGNSDIFIAKLNANDVLQWVRRGGSTTVDEANSIAVDREGSCYVTGSISGTANFSNTTGTVMAGSGTSLDLFIVKYNTSGAVVWVKRYGGTNTETGLSIAVDNDLNCYIAGSFSGSTTIGSTSFTSNGSTDGFIAKFNTLGNGVWTKRIGSTGSDKLTSVAIDKQGDAVFTGEFFGTVSVDAISLISAGSIDVVVGKYASNGTANWAKKIGSNSVEIAGAVETDSLNNVYVCGYATGNTGFDNINANITNTNGTTAAFISKFSSNGVAIWAQNNNGAGKNLVVSKDGFVVSVGSTTWAPTINNKTYASYGNADAVVNAVDYAGTYKWTRIGGTKFDDEWNDIATDANNNLFNVGDFRDTIILGNVVSNNSISNVNAGVIAKLSASVCSSPSMVRSTSIQNVCEGSTIQISALVGAINMPEFTWQRNGNTVQTNNFNYTITNFSVNDTGNYTFKVNYTCDSVIFPVTKLKLVPAYKCNAIPDWQWGASAGSNNLDIAIKHVTDKQRNTYVTGTFKNTMNFGSGNSITSSGGDDIFIAKYNSNGLFQWAKRIGGTDLFDKPVDLEVDTKGNIYLTGNCKGNAHVAGVNVNIGSSGFFLLKLNTGGNTEWLKTVSNTSTISPKGIAIDDSSNCFLIGDFSNALSLQDTTITTNGATNLFIAKYNEAGNLQWLSKTGNTTAGNLNSHVIATDIAVDKMGKNIYAIGRYRGTVFLNTIPLTVSPSDAQYILFKCTTDTAKIQWVKERGIYNDGLNNKIILDTKQSIYLNQNGIIKLDSNGNQLFQNTDVVAYNFITDSLNNLYAVGTQTLTGYVNGILFTQPSFFALKYNEIGDLQLVRRNNNFTGIDISIDDSLNMYVSGNFALNLSLNPQISLVNNSQLLEHRDIVIGKINTIPFVEPQIEAVENQTNAIGGIFSIVGRNLSLTNNVLVNNQNAIITSIEKNKVSAFILPNTANGLIQLQTSYGNATTNGQLQLFTVQAPNTQQGNKLTGSGISANGSLGSSVAISADGSTAVVGVPEDNNGAGAAIVYVKQQNTWVQQGNKLVGTGTQGTLPAKQGSAVAISADGNTIVVGAPGDIQNVGCVFVFTRINNTWQQSGNKIQGIGSFGTPGTTGFGTAVSIDAAATTIVVGSPNDNSGRGGIWIVKKSQTGIWSNSTSKLLGSSNANNSNFGSSVSISADGSTILVGGRGHANRGAAWIYKLENNIYNEDGGIIYNSSLPTGVNFGSAVATDGLGKTMAIAGVGDNSGTGAVWIYEKNAQTNIWTSIIKLTPASTGINFGSAIALSLNGNHLVVGSRMQASNNGSAVIYTKQNNSWNTTPSNLIVNDNAGAANIGTSIALSTNLTTLIVGGNGDNANAGAAWIFTNSGNTILPITLTNFTATKQNNTALLQWQSASEINAKQFDIECSINGVTYTKIGSIAAKGVAGNYQFNHSLANLPQASTVYYRLKMIDNDGSFSYSQIQSIVLQQIVTGIRIYPNPAKNYIQIVAENVKEIIIYNTNGKKVYNQLVQGINGLQTINVQGFASGLYYTTIITKNNETITNKFIKE